MPFLNQITSFINDTLKANSLNKKKLQPALFFGLSSTIAKAKGSKEGLKLEILPAVIKPDGSVIQIVPDSKTAIQIYHKLISKAYSNEKKSYGDEYDIKSVCEILMVVIINSKLTGSAKDVLEPVVLFGIPQRLSPALLSDLKISKCLITPVSSNMDPLQVFRGEYPQSDYFLSEQMSMFSIRYKIETTFSRACVDHCLCD